MDKRIQEFVSHKKQQLEQIKQDKKKTFLIEQGLCDKIYAPDQNNVDKSKYPHKTYNKKTNTYLYYKIEPIEISDEEYENLSKICKYIEKEQEKQNSINNTSIKNNEHFSFASFLMFFATAVIFVFGIVAIAYDTNNAITYLLTAFVGGCIFIALGKIIQLLTDIKNK